ncbi:MAG: GIY-YIG nuclease family protein [Syntrophomonadaceae bacterium]
MPDNEIYYVYMVYCSDGTLYTGICKDLGNRVDMHNQGRGAKYTRSRRPVKLAYYEVVPGRVEASRRERQIKQLSRKEKLVLIGPDNDHSSMKKRVAVVKQV